jgi:redox-sensitive bicupin YhaK (pirin superfamily)
MKQRRIVEVRAAHPSRDGDGVAIQRIAGMQHAGMDPVLMIDELRSENREDFAGGFPPHPHRGMQTLTYMKNGGIRHEDSEGNSGEIHAGGAQWMSAGRGVIHSEMPTRDASGLHGFQLWINLPRAQKMSAPRYRDVTAAELARLQGDGFELSVLVGEWHAGAAAARGPLHELEPHAGIADLLLEPGAEVTVAIPETESAMAYVYAGQLVHGEIGVGPQRLAVTDSGGLWTLRAGVEGASSLLLRGEPLREPVAQYGPFVMNTPEEIERALRDYQSGTFLQGEAHG